MHATGRLVLSLSLAAFWGCEPSTMAPGTRLPSTADDAGSGAGGGGGGGGGSDVGGGGGGSSSAPADAGTGGGARGEVCGNGIDDNGDTRIDEGCICTPGATQACFNGAATSRGLGLCRDGQQTCEEAGEFVGWGPCVGAVLPSAEIPGNGIDEDCDGMDPSSGCVPSTEQCTGGRDEDCDGLIDCDDPDCASNAACQCLPAETFGLAHDICKDGQDNDCDGLIDCADPDCQRGGREVDCGNFMDDDCDGLIDCFDPDCAGEQVCRNPDCECIAGQQRWCDTPIGCAWGKQLCMPNGRWGLCVETFERPILCLGDYYYNTLCCVLSGGCCQNYPFNNSVGACDGITCR